jgi:hypothetical protein
VQQPPGGGRQQVPRRPPQPCGPQRAEQPSGRADQQPPEQRLHRGDGRGGRAAEQRHQRREDGVRHGGPPRQPPSGPHVRRHAGARRGGGRTGHEQQRQQRQPQRREGEPAVRQLQRRAVRHEPDPATAAQRLVGADARAAVRRPDQQDGQTHRQQAQHRGAQRGDQAQQPGTADDLGPRAAGRPVGTGGAVQGRSHVRSTLPAGPVIPGLARRGGAGTCAFPVRERRHGRGRSHADGPAPSGTGPSTDVLEVGAGGDAP